MSYGWAKKRPSPVREKLLFMGLVISISLLTLAGCKAGPNPTEARGNIHLVVSDTDQNALAGAKVVSEEQPAGQLKVSGLTDSNGVVTFDSIAAGEYQFLISRFDYLPKEVTIKVIAGETINMGINLQKEPESSGPS